MIQISLPYVVEFVAALDGLANVVAGARVADVYGSLYNAKSKIDEFYDRSLYAQDLRSSRQLSATLAGHLATALSDFSAVIAPHVQWQISSSRDQFKTAFLAELGVMPSFFVTQKGGFDTSTLLNNPRALLPHDLTMKVPETLSDLDAMGHALAFDLGTAAGFHMFRILESVLRRYFTVTTGGLAAPKVRTIGAYTRALRSVECGDGRVLATLDQLAALHRNPLIHPEVMITTDQAVTLLGVVRSAVEAMLSSLPLVGQGPDDIAAMFAPHPAPPIVPPV